MMTMHKLLLAVLVVHAYVSAAPSEVTKLEDIAKVVTDAPLNEEYVTLPQEELITLQGEEVNLTQEEKDNNSTSEQSQRQKRYFNFYGYGFPPMNPIIYPNFYNRDDSYDVGSDDPFLQIYRRLQDISQVVRQPNFPPPPPPSSSNYPFYFPVLYVPQIGCACNPDQNLPQDNQNIPTTPTNNNGTQPSDVDITNRFPAMDDVNQNWGFVINETDIPVDDGQEEDFTRPISFEPIKPNRTMSRPPPPVEHGSSQAGQNQNGQGQNGQGQSSQGQSGQGQSGQNLGGQGQGRIPVTTTNRPFGNPTTSRPIANPTTFAPVEVPSPCDGAVLSCCHQPQVTYDCFAIQGCPDPTSYGNPCAPQVILSVIDKFQRFYGQRRY